MKLDDADLVTQPRSSKGTTPRGDDSHNNVRSAHMSPLEKWFVRRILSVLGKPDIYIALSDNTKIHICDELPTTGMHISDRRTLWRFIRNPGLYFGEEYSAGRIQVEGNLLEFLLAIFENRPRLHENNRLGRYLLQGARRRNRNTVARAQDNIYHHYDVGNEFYKLWLDEELVYTCAYYPDAAATLEQAQFAKLDYVCRKLELQPGQTVIEAGCGWGGLARHMAKHYGVKVKAYNVSHAQVSEARLRCKQQRLDDLVEFIEDDYRNISGTCDVFVSVGMLEHVGTANYQTLGDIIDNCLTEQGCGLIHSIGQNQSMPMNPWLVKHIFPGGYTPTLSEMMEVLEPRGFSVLDVENLGMHYARTLRDWLARFDQHEAAIHDMFDAEFVRAWRLYLAGSIANFTSGDLNLFQILFTRAAHKKHMPMNRAHLYCDNENPNKDSKAWKRATS